MSDRLVFDPYESEPPDPTYAWADAVIPGDASPAAVRLLGWHWFRHSFAPRKVYAMRKDDPRLVELVRYLADAHGVYAADWYPDQFGEYHVITRDEE